MAMKWRRVTRVVGARLTPMKPLNRRGVEVKLAGLWAAILLGGCGAVQPSVSPSTMPAASGSVEPSPTPVAITLSSAMPSPLPVTVRMPDGSVIALTVGTGEQRSIHRIDGDGTHEMTLAAGAAPAWSPDGRSIAFTCPAQPPIATQLHDVCIMAADGTAGRRLVEDGSSPHWAPSGRRLTFGRGVIDTGDAWIVDADGSNPVMLMAGTSPVWSPDGQWLLIQPDTGAFEIAVLRPDGTGFRSLTRGADGAWSPDSGRIAFAVGKAGGVSLGIVDVATGATTALIGAQSSLRAPLWLSPDRLVFIMDGDLYRLDLDSGLVTPLTAGLSLGGNGGRLTASPDGRWLAFAATSGAEPAGTIFLASVEGGWTRLTATDPSSDPAWRP